MMQTLRTALYLDCPIYAANYLRHYEHYIGYVVWFSHVELVPRREFVTILVCQERPQHRRRAFSKVNDRDKNTF